MPTKPPADGKHKVADGEWAGSIALNYGFTDWESIWNLPENDELRRNREDDAHTLAEGDVLFLPQWTQKEESGDTEQRHKFQLNTPSEVLRIRVLGENGEPLAGAQYILDITCTPGGGTFEQENDVTDDDGVLEEVMPSTAVGGTLKLPDLGNEIKLNIGHLTPMDLNDKKKLIRGAQERLSALGFEPGPIDGIDGPKTQAAVKRFQSFCKDHCEDGDERIINAGPIDGIVGPKTRKALKTYYGC